MKKIFVLNAAIFLCLSLAVSTAGAGGGEIAIKFGSYNMKSPQGDKAETKLRTEVELAPYRFLNKHLDVFGAMGLSLIDSSGNLETTQGSMSETSLDLCDVSLGMHLYPFAKLCNDLLTPYIGGGVGYYWSTAEKSGAGRQVGQGPGYTLHEIVTKDKTVSKGAFPFAVGGLRLRLGQAAESFPFLLIEGRYDFNKEDSGYDYSGATVSAGLGLQW